MDDLVKGLIGLFLSIIFYGVCFIPLKFKRVKNSGIDPVLFNLYMCIGIAISTLFVTLYQRAYVFTMAAVVAAVLWTIANALAVIATGYLGLALGSGIWSGLQVVVSFLWGAVYFHEPLSSVGLAVLALALLLLGVAGLSFSGTGLLPKIKCLQPLYHKLKSGVSMRSASLRDSFHPSTSTYPATPERVEVPLRDIGSPPRPSFESQSTYALPECEDDEHIVSPSSIMTPRRTPPVHVPSKPKIAVAVSGNLLLMHSQSKIMPKLEDEHGNRYPSYENMGFLSHFLHWLCSSHFRSVPSEEDDHEKEISQISPVPEPSNKLNNMITGFILCILVAVFGGSQFVPTKFVEPEAISTYVVTFGSSTMFIALMICVCYFLALRRVPELHFVEVFPAGLAAGFIWTIGYLSALQAIKYLGVGIGSCLLQLCLVEAGAISIFVFREMTDKIAIGLWSLSVVVLLSGAILLGYSGQV